MPEAYSRSSLDWLDSPDYQKLQPYRSFLFTFSNPLWKMMVDKCSQKYCETLMHCSLGLSYVTTSLLIRIAFLQAWPDSRKTSQFSSSQFQLRGFQLKQLKETNCTVWPTVSKSSFPVALVQEPLRSQLAVDGNHYLGPGILYTELETVPADVMTQE